MLCVIIITYVLMSIMKTQNLILVGNVHCPTKIWTVVNAHRVFFYSISCQWMWLTGV